MRRLDRPEEDHGRSTSAREPFADVAERYRLLAENASDVVFMTGPDRRIIWISPAVTDVLGWEPGELVGSVMEDLLRPTYARATEKDRVAFYSGSDPTPDDGYLFEMRTKSGGYRWLSGRGRPTFDADGRPSGAVAGLRDVDGLIRQREVAQYEAARRQAMLESLMDPHVLLEAVREESGGIVDFVYVDANEAACEHNQTPRERLIGMRLLDLLPDHKRSGLFDLYVAAVESGDPLVLNDFANAYEIDGAEGRFDVRGVRVGDALSLTWRDVTERYWSARRLAESEERYRLLAENSSDVVLVTRDNAVAWVSPGLTRVLGWTPESWVGHSMSEFGHPADLPIVEAAREQMFAGATVSMRIRLVDTGGTYHWVELHSKAFRDAQGHIDGIQSSFTVVDEAVEAEAQLRRQARFDDLTGALKRDPALEKLDELAHRPRSPGSETGVLFIDVDAFKAVNDAWGHRAGDSLLIALADRIRGTVRSDDVVARMGGDEFVVSLGGIHSLAEATAIAEKIRQACSAPVETADGLVFATVSIGVTLSAGMDSGDDVIGRADKAMYAAKRTGRNRVVALPPRST